MLSLEGKQLGNYDVIRRIRVGGMGAVYEGRQRTAFDRRVAIKVILGDYASDRDMRRRFAREARTVARLHHPHVLQLIEFGDEQGMLYLVMPFIEGGTLTSYLRRSLPDLEEISALYQQLLDAVEYAHEEGLIHRDIKSSNVLLEMRRNAPPYVYLADFGLVRTMRQSDPSLVGKQLPLDQVPGTPHYMAPEQTRGIVTPLTDIYALGVLLYQMLTGELPYNDPDEVRVIQMHMHAPIPSPSSKDASIPSELTDVVRTAMAKRPEERYRSVAELRKAFLAAVKGTNTQVQVEEEGILEDEYEPPLALSPGMPAPRRTQGLRPLEVPEPIIMPIRLQNETPVTAVGEVQEWRERVRVTDTINKNNRPRITEEPVQHRSKRKKSPLVVTLLVLIVLLLGAALTLPRVLGISIFPADFPVVGSSPIARVYITAQTKSLQNRYLLTASTLVSTPDIDGHRIPERNQQESAANTSTVNSTGVRTIVGTQAHGGITFTNATDIPIVVPDRLILVTGGNIHVQVQGGATVPARQNGQNSAITLQALVTVVGGGGNIVANALSGNCCTTNNNTLAYKNTNAFSGGTDTQITHYVTQADLDGVQNTQKSKLQQQVLQQIQSKLGTNEVLAGQPEYTMNVTSSVPVASPSDQVQVTVSMSGSAAIFNRSTAAQVAIQLLVKNANQTLNKFYQIEDGPALVTPPTVEQVKDGVIYLDVSVHGTWAYTFKTEQVNHWLQPIKGATVEAAQAYLKAQPGISAVTIQLPFDTNQLPGSTDNIQIVLQSHK